MILQCLACYLITGFFFLLPIETAAQDQNLADSLKLLYNSGDYSNNEFTLLNQIAINEPDPRTKLQYSELLIKKAEKDSSLVPLLNGYLQRGHAQRDLGNTTNALNSYFTGLKLANRLADQKSIGTLLVAIADTYSIMDNHENAQTYYLNSLRILRELNDSTQLASLLLNAGDEYFNNEKYSEALEFFKESGDIFKALDHEAGMAYNYGNVGMVYAEQGKDELAEESINKAITTLEKLEDYYPISVYLTFMADIYLRKNDLESAFAYSNKSLELAQTYDLKDQIASAHLKLAELNKQTENYENAYEHFQKHIAYRDSINNISAVQEMARIRTDYEISEKQAEVDLMAQKEKTQNAIVIATAIALLLIGILAFGLFRRNKFISRTKAIIEKERNRSDLLLQNILPEETALELKDSGKVKSKRFDSVSVLFGDFVGFTRYSEKLSPEELVECVDFYFSKFDEIIEKYGLEKIKTLGDCYMCAGGLPFPVKDHAQRLVLAAFEMQEFVSTFKAKSELNSEDINFNIKIGINSGPVVAGVVGTKKFAYDIWGDTVNIASRMESHSDPGQINVSETTCKLISKEFTCEYRGEVEVKNKGMMKMYYVKSIKEKAILDLNLHEPELENNV